MHNRSVGSWKRGSAVMQFRKSILVLVVLVECARFAAGTSHHPDDLSFYDSKRDRELICVADGHLLDSAIDWIYPIPRDPLSLPKICKWTNQFSAHVIYRVHRNALRVQPGQVVRRIKLYFKFVKFL